MAREDAHLVPEDSIYSEKRFEPRRRNYDDYEKNVLNVLRDAFAPNIFARAIILPSFQNEYAVAVSKTDDAYKIIHLEADVHVWLFEILEMYKSGEISAVGKDAKQKNEEEIRELEKELPTSLEDVAVNRCEREIPSDVGRKLYSVWGEMLFRTRYPDKRPISPDGDAIINVRTDGTNYHFSFEYHYLRLTGKTWSPSPDSVTGQFVHIAELIERACHSDDNEIIVEIGTRADQLAQELSSSKY